MSSLLKLQFVISITGLSRAVIYQRINRGEFPKPVKLGPRSVAWVESEVHDWVSSRIAERDRSSEVA